VTRKKTKKTEVRLNDVQEALFLAQEFKRRGDKEMFARALNLAAMTFTVYLSDKELMR
jgi:hypothetical protein